jgi:predicted nucleic acid-binding protein
VTCLHVVQEVIQGARDERAARQLEEGLLALPLLEPQVDSELYLRAAEIFRAGRRRGLTVRSSVDCLIAAIALRHDAVVVHLDRDFDAIAKYTDLRTERPKIG